MNKPRMKIAKSELNGNLQNLLTLMKTTMVRHGQEHLAKKCENECLASGNYRKAIEIVKKYLEIV